MPHTPTPSESEAILPPVVHVAPLERRAWVGVVGLVGLTVGSLALAWWLPNMTALHFVWVAQVVPVLYLLLAWWGIQPSRSAKDAH